MSRMRAILSKGKGASWRATAAARGQREKEEEEEERRGARKSPIHRRDVVGVRSAVRRQGSRSRWRGEEERGGEGGDKTGEERREEERREERGGPGGCTCSIRMKAMSLTLRADLAWYMS
eukprot:754230-Hanusia_phi.AAC.2